MATRGFGQTLCRHAATDRPSAAARRSSRVALAPISAPDGSVGDEIADDAGNAPGPNGTGRPGITGAGKTGSSGRHRRSSEPRKWTRRPAEGVKWGAARSDASGAPVSSSISTRHSTARTAGFRLGASVAAVGLAMLIPSAVSFLAGELETAVGILGAAAISVAAGSLAAMTSGRPSSIGMKDGFAAVGLTWFALTAAGALPYLMTGTIP